MLRSGGGDNERHKLEEIVRSLPMTRALSTHNWSLKSHPLTSFFLAKYIHSSNTRASAA
jgi:hypothetical protein